jgi:hypothetical protein
VEKAKFFRKKVYLFAVYTLLIYNEANSYE